MSFYKDLFSKAQEKEKLNGFQVLKSITINEFINELNKDEISIESIDKLFEKSCFMTIDSFLKQYYSNDTLKCQHYPTNGPEWFFICRDCCISEEIYLCGTCFFQGDHIKNIHTFQIIENISERSCDCGNINSMKKDGFCNHHSKIDEKSIRERLDKIPIYVKKDVHLFFRNLFLYIFIITYSKPETMEQSEAQFTLLETKIPIITDWLLLKSKQSSSLVHIIAEELSSRSLDTSIDYNNFQLYNSKQVPFKSEIINDLSKVVSTTPPASFGKLPYRLSISPLSYIFTNDSLLNSMLPFLGIISENHNVFKILMTEEYCVNYFNIFELRDQLSSDICTFMMFYCLSNDVLKLYSTGYSNFNFMELVLESSITIYLPMLHSLYQPQNDEDEVPDDLMLQDDISFIPIILKDLKVLKYFFSNLKLQHLFFKFAIELHKFSSTTVLEQSSETVKFITKLESTLIQSIKSILNSINEIKNEKSSDDQELILLDSIINNQLFEQIILAISKIKKRRELSPHQPFNYIDIPIHYPLYRILSTYLLLTKKDPISSLKNKLSEESIIEMVTTILLFRSMYTSYDTQIDGGIFEFCKDFTMTNDLHLLHISIGLLGCKKFITVLSNCMSGLFVGFKDKKLLKNVMILLIQAIQIRPMVIPDNQCILYHLLQGVYSRVMSQNDFDTFDIILPGLSPIETSEIYLPQIATNDDSIEKYLIDESNWRHYDPYYPFFSLNASELLIPNIKESFMEYQLSIGIPEICNPLPPQINPVPDYLGNGIDQMFNDSTFFEFIFNILVSSIYPNFKNYENQFDQQAILKKCFNNPLDDEECLNEFFYLLILSIKSFNQNGSNSIIHQDENEKESFIKLLNEYFKKNDTDKFNFKFSDKFENNLISNLLKVYNVKIGIDNYQEIKISILDCLLIISNDINLKKQESIYLNQLNYLAYIYETLVQFDSSIFKNQLLEMENAISIIDHSSILIENNLISVVPLSTTVTDNKPNDELLNENDDDESDVDDEEVEETNNNNNNSKCCVICKNGESLKFGRLYSMALIDLSSVKIQSLIQDIKYTVSDSSEYNNPLYKEFIKSIFDEIKPGQIQYLPNNDDPASLFACYLFQRSPSTFISSCNHNIHSKCLKQYNAENIKDDDQDEDDHQYPSHSFKCPCCKNPCDLLIPLGKAPPPSSSSSSSKQYKQDLNELFSNLCWFDFKDHMQQESKFSIDKYLWKFVLQNIETLELKSRKTNLYDDSSSSSSYYYLLTENQFQQDLETTFNLFNVIFNSVKFENNSIDSILPIYDQTSFFVDPFTSSSYSIFLSKDNIETLLNHGLSLHLFSILIHYCIKENVINLKDSNNFEIISKLILEKFNQLFSGKNSKQLDENTKQYLINQIFPYLRKLLIFKYLLKRNDQDQSNLSISLNDLSNFENCLNLLKFKSSIEELFSKLITIESLKETIGYYLKKKGIPLNTSNVGVVVPQLYSIYPPPNKYDKLPKFIEIENIFLDVMKNNTKIGCCNQCKQIFKFKCLICGDGICKSQDCERGIYNHQFLNSCQSYPMGFHQLIEQPLIQITTSQHGIYNYLIQKHLYKNKENDNNIYINDNQLLPFEIAGQKKKPIGISIQDLIVSKKRLKEIHKDWINHNYSKSLKNSYKIQNKFIV